MEISNEKAIKIYQKFIEDYPENFDISSVSNVNEYILLKKKITSLFEKKEYTEMLKHISIFSKDITGSSKRLINLLKEYNDELKTSVLENIEGDINNDTINDEVKQRLKAIRLMYKSNSPYSETIKKTIIRTYLNQLENLGYDTENLKDDIETMHYCFDTYKLSLIQVEKEKIIDSAILNNNENFENLIKVQYQTSLNAASNVIAENINKVSKNINKYYYTNADEIENKKKKETITSDAEEIFEYEIMLNFDQMTDLIDNQIEYSEKTNELNSLIKEITKYSYEIKNLDLLCKNSNNVKNIDKSLTGKAENEIEEKKNSFENIKLKYNKCKENIKELRNRIKESKERAINSIQKTGLKDEEIDANNIDEFNQKIAKIKDNIKNQSQKLKSKKQLNIIKEVKRKIGAVFGASIMTFSSQAANVNNIVNMSENLNKGQNTANITMDLPYAVKEAINPSWSKSVDNVLENLNLSNDAEVKNYINVIENMNINVKDPSQREQIIESFLYGLGILRFNWENNAKVLGLNQTWQSRVERMINTTESISSIDIVNEKGAGYSARTFNVGKEKETISIELNDAENGKFTSLLHELEHAMQIIPNTSDVEVLKKYLGDLPNCENLMHVIQEGGANLIQGIARENFLSSGFNSYQDIYGQFMSLIMLVGPNEFLDYMTKNAGENYDNFIKRKGYTQNYISNNLAKVQDEYIKENSSGNDGLIAYELIMGYSDEYIDQNIDKISVEYSNSIKNNENLLNIYAKKKGYSTEFLNNNKEKVQKELIDIVSSRKENFVEFVVRRAKEQGLSEDKAYEFLESFINSTVGTLDSYGKGLEINSVSESSGRLKNIYDSYKKQIASFKKDPKEAFEKAYDKLQKCTENAIFNEFNNAKTKDDFTRSGYKLGIFYDHILANSLLIVEEKKQVKNSSNDEKIVTKVISNNDKTTLKEKAVKDISEKMYLACENGEVGNLEIPLNEFQDIFNVKGQASNYIDIVTIYNDAYIWEKEHNVDKIREKIGDFSNLLEFSELMTEGKKVFGNKLDYNELDTAKNKGITPIYLGISIVAGNKEFNEYINDSKGESLEEFIKRRCKEQGIEDYYYDYMANLSNSLINRFDHEIKDNSGNMIKTGVGQIREIRYSKAKEASESSIYFAYSNSLSKIVKAKAEKAKTKQEKEEVILEMASYIEHIAGNDIHYTEKYKTVKDKNREEKMNAALDDLSDSMYKIYSDLYNKDERLSKNDFKSLFNVKGNATEYLSSHKNIQKIEEMKKEETKKEETKKEETKKEETKKEEVKSKEEKSSLTKENLSLHIEKYIDNYISKNDIHGKERYLGLRDNLIKCMDNGSISLNKANSLFNSFKSGKKDVNEILKMLVELEKNNNSSIKPKKEEYKVIGNGEKVSVSDLKSLKDILMQKMNKRRHVFW